MQKAKRKKNTLVAWSEDEVKLLKRLFPRGRAREIAERTGRTLEAVRHKAYKMGIKTREKRPWSAGELRQLKRLYRGENVQSIADKLGRSYEAVIARASQLGLTKEIRPWSKKELRLIERLYPSKTAQEIAEQMGRPVHAVRKKTVVLGLRKKLRYDDCHRIVRETKEKLCRKCGEWQGESQFFRDSSSKDGLKIYCKTCDSELQREYRSKRAKEVRQYLGFEERHRTFGGVEQKLCRCCNEWKNENEFSRNKSEKDGLNGRCKNCSYKATVRSRKR